MKNNYGMLNELSKQFTTSSFYILTECRRANGGGSAKFFQQLYIDTYYLSMYLYEKKLEKSKKNLHFAKALRKAFLQTINKKAYITL